MDEIKLGNIPLYPFAGSAEELYMGRKRIYEIKHGNRTIYKANLPTIAEKKWSLNFSGSIKAMSIDSLDDIYINEGKKILKINKEGRKLSTKQIENTITSLATDRFNNLYCGDLLGYVTKFNDDGMKIWSKKISVNITSLFIDISGNILVGSLDRKLVKLDPEGNKIWENDLNGTVLAISANSLSDVYIGLDSKNLIKLNQDGDKMFEKSLNNSIFSLKVDSFGNIYVGILKKLIKLDSSGNKLWEIIGNGIFKSIDIDDFDNVYSCNDEKIIKCKSNSDIVKEINLSDKLNIIKINSENDIFIGSDNKKLIKLSQTPIENEDDSTETPPQEVPEEGLINYIYNLPDGKWSDWLDLKNNIEISLASNANISFTLTDNGNLKFGGDIAKVSITSNSPNVKINGTYVSWTGKEKETVDLTFKTDKYYVTYKINLKSA